ncbi:MAG: hypothetical protein AABY10_04480 [Nanoarchaeota archaeon]
MKNNLTKYILIVNLTAIAIFLSGMILSSLTSISFIIIFLLPILAVIFSAKFIAKNKKVKYYFLSLIIPFSYLLLILLYGFLSYLFENPPPGSWGIYIIVFALLLPSALVGLIISVLINLIILKKK